jgi:hypothetical protein
MKVKKKSAKSTGKVKTGASSKKVSRSKKKKAGRSKDQEDCDENSRGKGKLPPGEVCNFC